MKICIVVSGGGHLTEISFLKPVFRKYNHYYVTFKRPNSIELARKEKTYFVEDPERNPLKLIKNLFQSMLVFIKEKPDIIVSTGAGVAVPTCYFGKIFGSKIVFIESFARITSPSYSGKLIYPIADLFILQWKNLKKFYPKAIFGGPLI